MSLAASFLILSLALSITGSPLEVRNSSITLPLTRRLNFPNGTISNFLQRDKARVAALGDYNTHSRRANNVPVTNSHFDWTVQVGVGSPPTFYNLVVDSGSSITWVGALKQYVKTVTSVPTDIPVRERYGAANYASFFQGMIYRDTITLGGELTVTNFKLAVASTFGGLDPGEDGYFGIGPRSLSLLSLPLTPHDMIPTFTDGLYDQRKIDSNVIGIFLAPTTDPDNRFGELTFGEPDNTKYTDEIVYTPVTDVPPASYHWGFEQKITYGQLEEEIEILGTTVGIIDSGSNFIAIATDAYERYKTATGAIVDPRTGQLKITPDQYSALQPLNFHIEGRPFSLNANAQIWPRSLLRFNPTLDPNNIYLVVMDIGSPTGTGLDFRIGYTFMQRFYTVLDGSNQRIGFAPTQFTDVTTD
ncbi:aspartic proteinase [Suillus spraguei]|nr:aspartic proteinase [Suillus spraguei]